MSLPLAARRLLALEIGDAASIAVEHLGGIDRAGRRLGRATPAATTATISTVASHTERALRCINNPFWRQD